MCTRWKLCGPNDRVGIAALSSRSALRGLHFGCDQLFPGIPAGRGHASGQSGPTRGFHGLGVHDLQARARPLGGDRARQPFDLRARVRFQRSRELRAGDDDLDIPNRVDWQTHDGHRGSPAVARTQTRPRCSHSEILCRLSGEAVAGDCAPAALARVGDPRQDAGRGEQLHALREHHRGTRTVRGRFSALRARDGVTLHVLRGTTCWAARSRARQASRTWPT